MKIQLLTAAVVIALTSSTAFAGKHHGSKGGGTDLSNKSKNALAIGDSTGASSSLGFNVNSSGGRAIAGSIYLTGGACACDFDKIKNRSKNAIAVGQATAGSVHVDTAMGGGPRPR
ncbi:hypothetical protein OO007_08805 [Cocleimonas sp. KMM 6892]|uniref:hypothetical protein n=1 Tax=unclassified Cocleimonas TaxID=2639732 RepID=UPI002DB8A39D|nr:MULTISPECIES: hypothetical protein [unclassified Cocleimonas]MEB8432326.1 hypothetical protein [Cocleimonas sp. KMM 6892]MEC4714588.1 hypothetical protein [Cocleimonas sp. KMM 6895]MEC4744598.1 hypothetical protein [Cocleimonas sp. KMM 6896]